MLGYEETQTANEHSLLSNSHYVEIKFSNAHFCTILIRKFDHKMQEAFWGNFSCPLQSSIEDNNKFYVADAAQPF